MSYEKKFTDKINSLSKELVNLVTEMIRTRSENPPGDERAISRLVGDNLTSLGFAVEFVEAAPTRVNTLGVLRGSGGGKNFLFNDHYDTMPAALPSLDAWSTDPFEAIVKDGRLYGRGASDSKGAIVAALIAARALVDLGIYLKGDFHIHAVADEEAGGKYGTKYLAEKGYAHSDKMDMAVVGEPSVFKDKIYARPALRGTQWIKITVNGKKTHSSQPQDGVNPVLKMSKILLALEKHKLKFSPHKLLPNPNLAPGTIIKAGSREIFNSETPELCEAICDVWVLPGMNSETGPKEVKKTISSLKDRQIDAEVSSILWWPPSEIPLSGEVYKIAEKATATATGRPLKPRGFPGYNDASWLNNIARIPTLAFGPGEMHKGGQHGPNEWVSVARLVDFAKIYGLMTMKACGTT